MARNARSVVADRIRIEDEVWEDAFATRVRSRPPRTRDALAPVPAQVVQDPLSGLAEELYAASSSVLGRGQERAPDESPRRTVRIQGRGAERNLPVGSSRDRARAPYEPFRLRPDRLAMWAVMLGLLLALAAMLSAHA